MAARKWMGDGEGPDPAFFLFSSSPRSSVSNKAQKPKKSQPTPSLTPLKDGKPDRFTAQVCVDMCFDIWMIRLGLVISCTTYIGYGLATQGWMFYIWSSLHAVAIIGFPSLNSWLTNQVEPSEFGAVLGAIQVVDSTSGVVSPVAISWVYAATVEDRPEAVWYAIAAATGVCARCWRLWCGRRSSGGRLYRDSGNQLLFIIQRHEILTENASVLC